MQKNIVGFLVVAALLLALGMGEVKAYHQVLSTGQTDCWNEYGNEIECKRTGQDGESQAGYGYKKFEKYMGYKRPIKRFKRKGYWVLDTLTGLRWYYQMGLPHPDDWYTALEKVNTQENRSKGIRMPNLRELLSLFEYMPKPPNEPNTGINTLVPEPNFMHFGDYGVLWTSTTCPDQPEKAYAVGLETGQVLCLEKIYDDASFSMVKSPRRAYEGMGK